MENSIFIQITQQYIAKTDKQHSNTDMKFTYCLQAMQLLVPFALLVFATGSESCGVHLVQRQIPPGPYNPSKQLLKTTIIK